MAGSNLPILDVRALPGTRETLACLDGGLFPILANAPGGAIVGIVRGGAGHLGLAGRVEAIRSTDAGQSWTPSAVIADSEWDDRDYAFGASPTGTLILAYHRTGCYDADGNYRAELYREQPGALAEVRVTRSRDGGYSWSPPQALTAVGQIPADLVALANGDLLLTYGNRNPPYRVEGRISKDGGHSWLALLLTFSGSLYGYNVTAPRPTDLGYPSSVVHRAGGGGRGVTLYYYNPTLWQPGDWRGGQQGALYRQNNYRAIAITWDEAELIAAVEAHNGEYS